MAAGMNVVRINCSHGDWDTRRKWREWIRESQPKVAPVGVLVDLQGPKFRIGPVPDGKMVLSVGQMLTPKSTATPRAMKTVPNMIMLPPSCAAIATSIAS